ncbi:MAG: cytidine deaminase [Nitriliruptorales bacterium]|nr:cytidine deaminase [Nitriliruptorales bacterium]
MRPDDATPGEAIDEADLLRRARAARERAYAPYSGFRVGCAVLTDDGRVFEAANVENASFTLGACAEMNAVRAMAATGTRAQVVAIAIVGDGEDACTPCGACRQVILEFGPDAAVYASGDGGRPLVTTIQQLLPHAFGPRRLAQGR